MILFTILALILIMLIVIIVLGTSVIGVGTIVVFGDVIICTLLIGWLIKKLFFKKKRK